MADINIQMTQRNAANNGWNNLYPMTKASNVIANDGTTLESYLADITAHGLTYSTVEDSNLAKTPGIYYATVADPNKPAGESDGMILVMSYGNGTYITQLRHGWNSANIYRRSSNGGTVWTPWEKILRQSDYNTLFQFANDGKTGIANAVNAKGVSASPSDTFATLAAKIGQINVGKKWASGTATTTVSSYNSLRGYLEIHGLSFMPILFIVQKSGFFSYYYYGTTHNNGGGIADGFIDEAHRRIFDDGFGIEFYNPNTIVDWIAVE